MQAHEVLRAAAKLVETAGWSEGGPAARDINGREVQLYRSTGNRSTINPDAAKFSAYGAIAVVLARPAASGVAANAMWLRLADAARAKSPSRPGGTNYLHPLVQFNADPERTAGDVVELLLEVAKAMEAEAAAVAAGRAS
jgi:hypothetical protein